MTRNTCYFIVAFSDPRGVICLCCFHHLLHVLYFIPCFARVCTFILSLSLSMSLSLSLSAAHLLIVKVLQYLTFNLFSISINFHQVKIVHICEATLVKRLIEFENTDSGSLTVGLLLQYAFSFSWTIFNMTIYMQGFRTLLSA